MTVADMPDDELELEIDLRRPREVGARVVILGAVVQRAFIESLPPGEERDEARYDLIAWLRDHDLERHAGSAELDLISAGAGTLSDADRDVVSWSGEALAALAWSTGLLPALGEAHVPAALDAIIQDLPGPWDAVEPFLARMTLKPEEEIAVERERAELAFWRAGVAEERRGAPAAERREIDDLVRETAREAMASGAFPVVDDDLAFAGVRFSALTEEEQEIVAAVAGARLHALNWLCGFGNSWDTVPLDI